MVKALPLLMVLAACAATPPPAPAPELDLATRISYWVETSMGDGLGAFRISGGTANPVGPDLFLTAAHVVDVPDYYLRSGLTPSYTVGGLPVSEVLVLEGLDAALLRTSEPHGMPVWPMDDRMVLPGERLVLTGWGYGDHRFKPHMGCVRDEHSSGECAPGDSGGALLDADGDIVAILVAVDTRPYADHHAYQVPVTAILAQMRAQGLTLEPWRPSPPDPPL